MGFKLVLCLFLAIIAISSALPVSNKEKLRFKVAASGLPDKDDGFGTIDPYVIITYTEGGSTSESKVGRSDTITDNENPDWGNIFEFDFDRAKDQKWHFKIYDHDNLRDDDKGGQTWVDVSDFVDKGQITNANLDKQGYLTVRAVSPPATRSGFVPGSLPFAPGTPETGVLKFKLSANNLPDKDNFGKSDPYVEVFSTEGLTGKKTKIGRSGTLSNTKNPAWGDTFTLNWDKRREQRLFFKVYDDDNLREDDTTGKAWVEVNDYVAHGQSITINLHKRGTLTLTRADGLPVTPYNPAALSDVPYSTSPQGPPGFVAPQNQNSGFKGPSPVVLAPSVPAPASPPATLHTQNYQGPAAVGAPVAPVLEQPIRLSFKLSGSRFPDKDYIGTSDPYVRVYITQDGLAETLLKKGSVKIDDENPQWPDIYDFTYDKNKHPKLRFLVLDEDDNKRDEEIGNVSLDPAQLLQRNVVDLPMAEGTLTVTRL